MICTDIRKDVVRSKSIRMPTYRQRGDEMNIHQKCERIIEKVKADGFIQVTDRDLLPYIMRDGGGDPRTIRKYMTDMIVNKLIYPIKDSIGFSTGIYALSRTTNKPKVKTLMEYVK